MFFTDSLGMARGSNPNPYASQYIGYANGGVIGMDTGGEFDNYDDNRSAVDIAGLQGPFVTGRLQDDGTLGPNLTYEQVIAASPQRQEGGQVFCYTSSWERGRTTSLPERWIQTRPTH